jgi:DNA gyrase subunit B
VSEKLHVSGDMPAGDSVKSGTKVQFKPDHEIFQETEFNHSTLEHRMRELAYLNPGVTIRLTDERVGADGQIKDETFCFQEGIAQYVEHMNANKTTMCPVIHFKINDEEHGLLCEIAMQYSDSYNEITLSFANNIRTVDGGTHLSGFKTALTRTLNTYAKKANVLKEKDPSPSGDDLREGLAAVVSVKLPEPQFEGQTKGKLRNTEVEGYVSSAVSQGFGAWLEEHPSEAKKICMKGVLAAQAREAARRARDLTRRKSALESGSMPHKLRDCTTKDVDRSEMFIVEGDSAGGSATQGRDVETQAILPLRGKLLNVEKARLDKILAFEEIRTLISAMKCGIGEEFDIAKLRYGRIIIMTDADVDGSHIRTLLLTFFFRQMPELIRRGKVYIAQPPLYQLSRGKREQYVLNEREMDTTLAELGLEGSVLLVRDIDIFDDATGLPKVVRRLEGDDLTKIVKKLRRLTELAEVVERRGLPFVDLLHARDNDPSGGGRLPTHMIRWTGGESLAFSEAQVQEILKARGLAQAVVGEQAEGETATVREMHECKELALVFAELLEFGLDIEDYATIQEEAVTGEKLPTKYAWLTSAKRRSGADDGGGAEVTEETGKIIEAANLPSVLTTLHDVGRRGFDVKRFKGLGEMDPEQLWETTMDYTKRTMMLVNWDDASAADELFTILMGENVEQRRAYIEEHALEVKSLDV